MKFPYNPAKTVIFSFDFRDEHPQAQTNTPDHFFSVLCNLKGCMHVLKMFQTASLFTSCFTRGIYGNKVWFFASFFAIFKEMHFLELT